MSARARLAPLILACATLAAAPPEGRTPMSLHDFTVQGLDGRPVDLGAYKGKVVLVVNVASECGYTPQYAGLQRLHTEFSGRGVAVLGFPCNQFGAQEPGSPQQIQAFCSRTYGVTFPMFAKVEVKGRTRAPLYEFLATGHGEPKWNFHKYLVGRDGKVLRAFPSATAPDAPELRAALEAALK